ncbi:MAG: hypothetical protein JWM28_3029, partial [Chitinophagaceae bacterium]|nr:hypothetical protein [Chitinophagaceae bacterium]
KTDVKGFYVFDRKAGFVSHFDLPNGGFELNNDYEMITDRRGLIWTGTIGNGIYVIDPQKQTIRHISKLPGSNNANVKQIMEDKEGNIWLGSINGLSIIDPGSGKIRFLNKAGGLLSDTITGLFMDSESKIWAATVAKGVDLINSKEGTIKHISKAQGINNVVNHFSEDNNRNLWLASDNGVYIFESSLQKLKHIDAAKGLSDNKIKTILRDNREQIWIATYAGLNLVDTKGIMPDYLTESNGLSGTDVWSFIKDTRQRIWIGSLSGMDIYYPDKQIIKSVEKELQMKKGRNISYYFTPAQNGKILISAAGYGLGIVDPGKDSITYITKAQGQQNIFPSSILEDNTGRIWTGSFQKRGIEIIDLKKNSFSLLTNKNGLTGSIVWALMQDHKGQIWAATDSGLNIIDPVNKTIRYLTGDGDVDKENGGCLLMDDEERVWIGTRNGILIADEKNKLLTTITTNQGLPAPDMYTLFKHKGRIYAGTGNGLTVFAPKGTDSSSRQNQFEWKMKSYGKGQGLIYTNFNANAVLAYNDKLWWGIETKALTITNEPRDDSSVALTYISGISISDKIQNFVGSKWLQHDLPAPDTIWSIKKDTFYLKDKLPAESNWLQKSNITWDSLTGYFNLPVNLVLPYSQNYLSFQFAGSPLSNRDKTRYRYILQGHDKKWSAITDNPFSENYRDLAAGKYIFKVCSMGFNGLWSPPAAFSFTVRPPWWNTWWAYLLYAGIFYIIVRGIVAYRSRWLKEENQRLEKMVTKRTNELSQSLNDLKATQSQLVQSEKMASLGELTAGIAHEIQNPLNFVNNFSEVNRELIEEMKEELIAGHTDQAISIANDIKDNEEKIGHHGKRADSIVKGMLQHSGGSSNVKEPTDINALADEYLRLSWHGLRARDKSFNATIKTDFNETIGKINIIPQDIGRVLLNLYNNAFYAVLDKKKSWFSTATDPADKYEPTVSVSTKKIGDKIEIRVKDNGNGVPQKVIDKIFQPFFTTKPTGQGTGLGLSLSYDIIKKGHSGELKVETKEGEGAEFIIQLP